LIAKAVAAGLIAENIMKMIDAEEVKQITISSIFSKIRKMV
jgi:hypothetical protein